MYNILYVAELSRHPPVRDPARSRTEVVDQEEAAPHREKRHALQPAQPRWAGRKSKIQITKTATPNVARTLSGGSEEIVKRPYLEEGSKPVEHV